MAGFTQWRTWAAKKDIRKVTYVYGDEPFLVEQVVEDMKSIVAPPSTDYLTFDASNTLDSAIWVEAMHAPLDPQANRLIVVRCAEQFQDWAFLPQWLLLTKHSAVVYIVFVSNEVETPEGEHIDLIQSKGRLVRCTIPGERDLANWLVDDYGLSYESADFLVKHASGNLDSMINVCRKARLFSASPKPAVIAQLCAEESHDSFVDSLILGDKKSALRAIRSIDEDSYSRQIGMLDSRLSLIQELSTMTAKHMGLKEICAEPGMKAFLVRKFLPCVRKYTDSNIHYCRKLLVVADNAIQTGARKGVLEMLVAMWK